MSAGIEVKKSKDLGTKPETSKIVLENAANRLMLASNSGRKKVNLTGHYLGLRATRGRPVRLTELVREGLPFRSIEVLASELKIPASEFIKEYMDISRATANRRRKAGHLSTDESDKAVRYARLMEKATELMEGDEVSARKWLLSPLPVLDGESPLEHARTEAGAHEVETIIGRLEYGIFN